MSTDSGTFSSQHSLSSAATDTFERDSFLDGQFLKINMEDDDVFDDL